MSKTLKSHLPPALAALLLALSPRPALAHCDTLDGPVVADAGDALESRDATPVLKWVRPQDEPEIRESFQRALEVRQLGAEARRLADRFFFETLVRVHREGEGAPYTGLKPAGGELEPGVAAADEALESGSVEALVQLATRHVELAIRERYRRAAAARAHRAESVERGREYVAAYVELVHYAERLLADAGHGPHGLHEGAAPAGHATAVPD